VLWKPAFFGVKPEPDAQGRHDRRRADGRPQRLDPDAAAGALPADVRRFRRRAGATSLTFVSQAALANPACARLGRAAYHLGNRHVPVQLGEECLRFQPDHVLAAMLVGLGCDVSEVEAPFDPEGGAYGAAAHAHTHGEAGGSGHDYRPTKGRPAADPHDPGHGPHRSLAKIHEFK
jgi:hypothetical protein